MIGKRMAEVIIPDRFRDDHHLGLQNYLETGNGALLNRRVEMPALRSDGTEFPVELSITRVLIENRVLFTAFLRDISEQKRAEETIRILSTPVLKVRRGLLILPLIGSMDKQRVDQLREQLLSGIRTHRAKVVVIDITGIAFVDIDSVKQILDIVAAARLMGAQVILTGMSKLFSEALLSANIRFDTMISVGDLQRGIEESERILNIEEMTTVDGR
jgi:rsbT co-antagonist protein RsbR